MSSNRFPTPTHLIIVCCHGIWLGHSPDESNWLIQDFQRGETPTFIEHIKIGLRLLTSTPAGENVLMFSGAPTRPESHISEAESYLSLTQSQSFFTLLPSSPTHHPSRHSSLTPPHPYTPHLIAETRALDSFQNLTLSLSAFTSLYGTSPKRVTVISHAFKRPRFEELHFPVLASTYPGTTFEFIGQDPPYMVEGTVEYDEDRAREVREAERKNGYQIWAQDPKGEGEEVVRKRKGRDIWGVQFPVADSGRPENLTELINGI